MAAPLQSQSVAELSAAAKPKNYINSSGSTRKEPRAISRTQWWKVPGPDSVRVKGKTLPILMTQQKRKDPPRQQYDGLL